MVAPALSRLSTSAAGQPPSCCRRAPASHPQLRRRSCSGAAFAARPGSRGLRQDALIPAVLAALLVLTAAVVAPERPQDQEAICQRHNGVDACRVW
jgi:hypothetical protein